MTRLLSRLFRRPAPQVRPLRPLTHYVLKHEFGPEHHFACLPEHVLYGLWSVRTHGLSDVCREALAHGVQTRPDRPACYGMWTLEAVL